MPFTKGKSGNPNGRPKWSGEWAKALWEELDAVDPRTKERRLKQAAHRLVQAAIGGDVVALKEIGDRVDGKAMQHVSADVTVNGDVAEILQRRRQQAGLAEPEVP